MNNYFNISSMKFIASFFVIPLALAATFSDVPPGAWYAAHIQQASELGIVSGYKDASGTSLGLFKPADNVTLAEALKMSVESAGYDYEKYAKPEWENNMKHWIAPYYRIATTEGFGIFVGATEDVNAKATRREVASIVVDAFFPGQRTEIIQSDYENPYKDVSIQNTYQDGSTGWGWNSFILKLTEDGVLTGDTDSNGKPTGYFRPDDLINRAEAVKIVLTARSKYGTPGQNRPK